MIPTVSIVYKYVPKYREPFFRRLRDQLAPEVCLRIVYGDPPTADRPKKDDARMEGAVYTPSRFISAGGRELIWQPVLDAVAGSQLVVVEQASRLLVNYVLLARRRLGGPPVAFWGHGRNLQKHRASRTSEALKARVSRWPDWWFTYTEGTRRIVESLPYPSSRITVVQNTVDTEELAAGVKSVTAEDCAQFRQRFGLGPGPVALFVGSLYEDKRLGFLIEAARRVRDRLPGFTLAIAGDGPQRDIVESAARERAELTYLGRADGQLKAIALASADVLLMPGLIGLAVADSFAASVPLVGIELPYHSPEFEYLRTESNALVLPGGTTSDEYAHAVAALLQSSSRLDGLRQGCAAAARTYSMDAMVSRFSSGVHQALAETS